MSEINEVRYRDTMMGVIHIGNCICCGTRNVRWADEKIKCKYCGELI